MELVVSCKYFNPVVTRNSTVNSLISSTLVHGNALVRVVITEHRIQYSHNNGQLFNYFPWREHGPNVIIQ